MKADSNFELQSQSDFIVNIKLQLSSNAPFSQGTQRRWEGGGISIPRKTFRNNQYTDKFKP